MNKAIQEELIKLSETEYRDFSQSLIPESKPLLGVRLPLLRKYAKEIVKGTFDTGYQSWENLIDDKKNPDKYFEEVMLRGMIIGFGTAKSKNVDNALQRLDEFIKYVDNWSICDSFCVSFTIAAKYKEDVFNHIKKYLYSEKEFEVRVGLIMLLDHFLKCDKDGNKIARKRKVTIKDVGNTEEKTGKYTEIILDICNRSFNQGYYASMAAAWLIAECFVIFPYTTMKFIENNNMDSVTLNKSIQKICESKTPDDEVKQFIKKYKVQKQ